MKDLLKLSPAFTRLLAIIAVMALAAPPLVYWYSSVRTAAEVKAASYTPPPTPEPLNQVLIRRQLEAAKQRVNAERASQNATAVVTMSHTPPPAEAAVADVDDDTRDHERSPSTDPFGHPLDEDGNWIGPDPCASYVKPDFTLPKWQERCAIFQITHKDCPDFLTMAWESGDTSVDPSFELPDGCE